MHAFTIFGALGIKNSCEYELAFNFLIPFLNLHNLQITPTHAATVQSSPKNNNK